MTRTPTDRPQDLQVWLGGEHVADLSEKDRARVRIEVTHTSSALNRWGFSLPLLSCSLPTTDEPQPANAWLDGFLPEGQARATMAATRGLVASDTWAMLIAFVRDIARAMRVIDPERAESAARPHVVNYTTDELETAVNSLADRPLDIHDDSELSLADITRRCASVDESMD